MGDTTQHGLERSGGVSAYREVLGLPGVAALTAVGFFARIPSAAAAVTLTLHVVLTLDHGYAAAGLVGSAATIGMAVGAPLPVARSQTGSSTGADCARCWS